MPYVNCPNCSGLTYAPRSHLYPVERCPICDAGLDVGRPRPIIAEAGREEAAGSVVPWPQPEIGGRAGRAADAARP